MKASPKSTSSSRPGLPVRRTSTSCSPLRRKSPINRSHPERSSISLGLPPLKTISTLNCSSSRWNIQSLRAKSSLKSTISNGMNTASRNISGMSLVLLLFLVNRIYFRIPPLSNHPHHQYLHHKE